MKFSAKLLLFALGLIYNVTAHAHLHKCPHTHNFDGSISWSEICSKNAVQEHQHGFILSEKENLAVHLVASGVHSRQVIISGELHIEDKQEELIYYQRRTVNQSNNRHFFLLQAQNLDLDEIKPGDSLSGHIIQSEIGKYQPNQKIVSRANFEVHSVQLNLVNPFFQ